MSKIYNEIVIDMNPESPTFEETLYEDSFEYSGDMMFMQEAALYAPFPNSPDEYIEWVVDDMGTWQMQGGTVKKDQIPGDAKVIETAPIRHSQAEEGNSYETLTTGVQTISGQTELDETAEDLRQETVGTETAGKIDWGAANITKEMFINPDGSQRTIQEVYNELDPILTGITGQELVNQINDMFPKYTGAKPEEKEAVERQYKADIYGLQAGVGEAVAPTTGAGARGQIAAKTGVKKGFEAAGEARKYSLYGLEEAAGGKFETGISQAIGEMDTAFAPAGTTGQTTAFDAIEWSRAGGKVRDKGETFLDFLTQLPDAGGV